MINFQRTFQKFLVGFFLCPLSLGLIIPPDIHAQNSLHLPVPGVMVRLSPAQTPPILRGLKVHPDNPFQFDFVVDSGDSLAEEEDPGSPIQDPDARSLIRDPRSKESRLKEESKRLIKYFLASLTIPEEDLWVNLSPHEPDRIIPNELGQTEMGRDLLAQDYILKQLTASLLYPEDELGKKFWERIRQKAYEEYGTTDIPMETFHKVWIVPQKAVVYENGATAFVVEGRLKVMLEEDYVALEQSRYDSKLNVERSESNVHDQDNQKALNIQYSTLNSQRRTTNEIMRELILPAIEKEVNQGTHFAQLRQIYYSLILATWFKRRLKQSLLGQIYADQKKIAGVDTEDPEIQHKIYEQYLTAYRKGVYDYIKEDYDQGTQEVIPRKYFSGGVELQVPAFVSPDAAQLAALRQGFHNLYTVPLNFQDAAQLGSEESAHVSRVGYTGYRAAMPGADPTSYLSSAKLVGAGRAIKMLLNSLLQGLSGSHIDQTGLDISQLKKTFLNLQRIVSAVPETQWVFVAIGLKKDQGFLYQLTSGLESRLENMYIDKEILRELQTRLDRISIKIQNSIRVLPPLLTSHPMLGQEALEFLLTPEEELHLFQESIVFAGDALIDEWISQRAVHQPMGKLFEEWITRVLPLRNDFSGFMRYLRARGRLRSTQQSARLYQELQREVVSLVNENRDSVQIPLQEQDILFISEENELLWLLVFYDLNKTPSGKKISFIDPETHQSSDLLFIEELETDLEKIITLVREADHTMERIESISDEQFSLWSVLSEGYKGYREAWHIKRIAERNPFLNQEIFGFVQKFLEQEIAQGLPIYPIETISPLSQLKNVIFLLNSYREENAVVEAMLSRMGFDGRDSLRVAEKSPVGDFLYQGDVQSLVKALGPHGAGIWRVLHRLANDMNREYLSKDEDKAKKIVYSLMRQLGLSVDTAFKEERVLGFIAQFNTVLANHQEQHFWLKDLLFRKQGLADQKDPQDVEYSLLEIGFRYMNGRFGANVLKAELTSLVQDAAMVSSQSLTIVSQAPLHFGGQVLEGERTRAADGKNFEYRILDRIGRGAYGSVWRAIYQEQKIEDGEPVWAGDQPVLRDAHAAVKIFSANPSAKKLAAIEWEMEIQRLAAHSADILFGRKVAKIIDRGTFNESPFYVMRLFEQGKLLRKMLEEKKTFSFQEAVDILTAIAESVRGLHNFKISQTKFTRLEFPAIRKFLDSQENALSADHQGWLHGSLIHQDLKPENIILQQFRGGWLARILDMGTARFAGQNRDGDSEGTPFYIPPEVLGKFYHPEVTTDIYALGVMFYELTTGTLPFTVNVAESPEERFLEVLIKQSLWKGISASPSKEWVRPAYWDQSFEDKPLFIQIIDTIDKTEEWIPAAFQQDSDYPKELQAVLSRALDPEPVNRHQSVEEFIRDLQQALPAAESEVDPKDSDAVMVSPGAIFDRTEQDLHGGQGADSAFLVPSNVYLSEHLHHLLYLTAIHSLEYPVLQKPGFALRARLRSMTPKDWNFAHVALEDRYLLHQHIQFLEKTPKFYEQDEAKLRELTALIERIAEYLQRSRARLPELFTEGILSEEQLAFLNGPAPQGARGDYFQTSIWSAGNQMLSHWLKPRVGRKKADYLRDVLRQFSREIFPLRDDFEGFLKYLSQARPLDRDDRGDHFLDRARQRVVRLINDRVARPEWRIREEQIIFLRGQMDPLWFVFKVPYRYQIEGRQLYFSDRSGEQRREILVVERKPNDFRTMKVLVHEAVHSIFHKNPRLIKIYQERFGRVIIEGLQAYFEIYFLWQLAEESSDFALELREIISDTFLKRSGSMGSLGSILFSHSPEPERLMYELDVLILGHFRSYSSYIKLVQTLAGDDLFDPLWTQSDLPLIQFSQKGNTRSLKNHLGVQRYEALRYFLNHFPAEQFPYYWGTELMVHLANKFILQDQKWMSYPQEGLGDRLKEFLNYIQQLFKDEFVEDLLRELNCDGIQKIFDEQILSRPLSAHLSRQTAEGGLSVQFNGDDFRGVSPRWFDEERARIIAEIANEPRQRGLTLPEPRKSSGFLLSHFSTDPRVVEEVLSRFGELGLAPDSRIVSIGEERGHFVQRLQKKGFQYVVGMDLSLTHGLEAVHHRRVPQAVASARRMPVKEGSQDLLVLNESLGAMPLRDVLPEFVSILKPGGRIFISDYALDKKASFQSYRDRHYMDYSESEMRAALKAAGFVDIENNPVTAFDIEGMAVNGDPDQVLFNVFTARRPRAGEFVELGEYPRVLTIDPDTFSEEFLVRPEAPIEDVPQAVVGVVEGSVSATEIPRGFGGIGRGGRVGGDGGDARGDGAMIGSNGHQSPVTGHRNDGLAQKGGIDFNADGLDIKMEGNPIDFHLPSSKDLALLAESFQGFREIRVERIERLPARELAEFLGLEEVREVRNPEKEFEEVS